MKEKNMRARTWTALLWGIAWGITEATLGHLLHAVKIPGLAGFIMFPVAVFFMLRVYFATNRMSLILWTSCMAAGFKALDIFIIPFDVLSALNPALAILSESLALVLFLAFFHKRSIQNFFSLFFLAIGWKFIYTAFLTVFRQLYAADNFLYLSLNHVFHFFLVDSLVSSALIFLFFKIPPFSTEWHRMTLEQRGISSYSSH
ncbi:MAG: hypothetical protein GF421_08990 [Candidatus Aminicenantes bacterium]|nr:hypothetical protein [Candidatus Aminicenantes bacterium]